ncbi:tigger transposable element-derived protein 4-like [Aphis craccivora]|uniref:Tigger transposable element-derived protein 4-like n=1 Tax=Aphis craccivora TaxID=307492 RepID=A0A6G0Z4G4_APHCR|nr:tigger transposable element-derived protein 4-like [Aphis craccivora]
MTVTDKIVKSYPLDYESNKKEWITSEFLKDKKVPINLVLLLIANYTAHKINKNNFFHQMLMMSQLQPND